MVLLSLLFACGSSEAEPEPEAEAEVPAFACPETFGDLLGEVFGPNPTREAKDPGFPLTCTPRSATDIGIEVATRLGTSTGHLTRDAAGHIVEIRLEGAGEATHLRFTYDGDALTSVATCLGPPSVTVMPAAEGWSRQIWKAPAVGEPMVLAAAEQLEGERTVGRVMVMGGNVASTRVTEWDDAGRPTRWSRPGPAPGDLVLPTLPEAYRGLCRD
jgi:hypothetical protein